MFRAKLRVQSALLSRLARRWAKSINPFSEAFPFKKAARGAHIDQTRAEFLQTKS